MIHHPDPLDALGLDPRLTDEAIRRRWPPEKYPALWLPAQEYLDLRTRECERARILDLIGEDLARTAAAGSTPKPTPAPSRNGRTDTVRLGDL